MRRTERRKDFVSVVERSLNKQEKMPFLEPNRNTQVLPADSGIGTGFLPVTYFLLYLYVQYFSLPYIYFSTM